ncbi:hypothetical protein QBC39DRAFT_364479, partial [Podospora conica]
MVSRGRAPSIASSVSTQARAISHLRHGGLISPATFGGGPGTFPPARSHELRGDVFDDAMRATQRHWMGPRNTGEHAEGMVPAPLRLTPSRPPRPPLTTASTISTASTTPADERDGSYDKVEGDGFYNKVEAETKRFQRRLHAAHRSDFLIRKMFWERMAHTLRAQERGERQGGVVDREDHEDENAHQDKSEAGGDVDDFL